MSYAPRGSCGDSEHGRQDTRPGRRCPRRRVYFGTTLTPTRRTDIKTFADIRAITFDFWHTLYAEPLDESTETSRAERMAAVRDALRACGLDPGDEELQAAWRSGFAAYLEAWGEGRHFGAREQVGHVLGLFDATPFDGIIERAASRIEESGATANLLLQPGAAEVIPALAGKGIKLGLISDTGLTPGRILVGFLERDGLLSYFSSLTFSDKTGFPKPDPRMFHRTLSPLGVPPKQAIHVGDTPRTDIAGALRVGMHAVRFAASHDSSDPPEADAVICDHRELPALAGL